MASKFSVKARDPAKVAALRAVVDKAYYTEVEILSGLIDQPVPQFSNPQSPKEWARAASSVAEKDMTFRANAAAARSRAIQAQTQLCVTLLDATPEINEDDEEESQLAAEEARRQRDRDFIAAIRGQMDPNKIKELERANQIELGGSDE